MRAFDWIGGCTLGMTLVLMTIGACDRERSGRPEDGPEGVFVPPDADAGDDVRPEDGEVALGHTDSGSQDIGREDGTLAETGPEADTGQVTVDTSVADTSVADTSVTDTIAVDTSVAEDTRVTEDTSVADTIAVDTSVADTIALDTSVADTIAVDTSVADTGVDGDAAAGPAGEAPEIGYTPGGARTLFFLNNPEQLVASDLGDASLGDKTLYRVNATGACRSFFEHVNRSGRTIGFGIQVYNPGPSTVTVTVRAAGWVASILGGAPFADALNGAGAAAPVELAAGRSTWILRKDEAVSQGTFFSGVLDFDVGGGSVIVNHIAYDGFAGLDGSTSELGYVQRVEPDGTHEARMYKGVATASEADAGTLELEIDDATPSGALAVRVARYDLGVGAYLPTASAREWTTHIGPAQNTAATTSDMVGFEHGAWFFDPLTPSDGEGRHPNLGNWGVVYRLRARLTNTGTRTRRLAYRITASPGAGAGLAKQAQGGPWSAHRIEKGVALELGAITVPPGATRDLDVAWVLGGPSGGGLKNELVVD